MKKKYLVLGIGAGIGGAVAAKLLLRAKTVDWQDFKELVHHPENSHFVEVDGNTVHYQEFGDKTAPTIILIHGYTASTYVWKTVAPQFAEEGFRVISVDLLGFGFSDKPAGFDYTIAGQARMVERFMNHLGIGRAMLVGSSYGGAVAMTIALDYAERVEKLVLVDAVINDVPGRHPILKLAGIRGIGEVVTPFLIESKAFLKMRMKGTLAPENHELITRERIESVMRPLKAADGHYSLLQTARNWDAERIERDAPLINQQTLILWGEKDKVIPLSDGEKLFNSILKSRLIVFQNCGHVPQEENSELFVNLVGEFCRKGIDGFELNEIS